MNPEILHLYAWDVAYEIPLAEVRSLLGPSGDTQIRPEKAAPRDLPHERSLRVPLPQVEAGGFQIAISANLFAFGVIALTLRYTASGARLGDFASHHDPVFPGGSTLNSIARRSLDEVMAKIQHRLKRPRISPDQPEAYTVFRFTPDDVGMKDAAGWLIEHGLEVAGLITGEADPGRLSGVEVEETLAERFSYYRDDLVVIDWDAALVIDRSPAADVLRVLELANLQLVEYRHYDQELDAVVGRAYGDLERLTNRRVFSFSAGGLLGELRELRISLSEVADEIENATKYIGDWHLARQYLGCATRFHIPEWRRSVEEKLKTLDELYNLVATESSNQKMLILEIIIVVLFVIDLAVLAFAAAK
ncbi:MAG: hypothetical protein K8T20_00345 [Planctomycetes bacterium]|nr:hypothetical protein [Planctomycetota bacterium]